MFIIKLINLKNQTINFDSILTIQHTLYIKNCYNIKIIIHSKINKIIIDKSSNIFTQINYLISGFDINYSQFVFIHSDTFNYIPIIDIYKSSCYLIGNIDKYKYIKIISSFSDLYNID